MGRHRKEKVKIKLGLSVEAELKEKLTALDVNMSQLFTNAALKEASTELIVEGFLLCS